jgi:hypothetical protein
MSDDHREQPDPPKSENCGCGDNCDCNDTESTAVFDESQWDKSAWG